MTRDDLAGRMRAREYFHTLKVLAGTWLIVRLDGRGFSRLARKQGTDPFEREFFERMLTTAEALMREFQPFYVYLQGDEISLVFEPEWALFAREVEKIVSLTAGLASAVLTHTLGQVVHFDSRLWLGTSSEDVSDYCAWRQQDATRNALLRTCRAQLRQEGRSSTEAARTLEGLPASACYELLLERGLDFNELPTWLRRGAGLRWVQLVTAGVNPLTGEATTSGRRQIERLEELPAGANYAEFVRNSLQRFQEEFVDGYRIMPSEIFGHGDRVLLS